MERMRNWADLRYILAFSRQSSWNWLGSRLDICMPANDLVCDYCNHERHRTLEWKNLAKKKKLIFFVALKNLLFDFDWFTLATSMSDFCCPPPHLPGRVHFIIHNSLASTAAAQAIYEIRQRHGNFFFLILSNLISFSTLTTTRNRKNQRETSQNLYFSLFHIRLRLRRENKSGNLRGAN